MHPEIWRQLVLVKVRLNELAFIWSHDISAVFKILHYGLLDPEDEGTAVFDMCTTGPTLQYHILEEDLSLAQHCCEKLISKPLSYLSRFSLC